MGIDRSEHPCFSASARHQFARVHVPVAPQCNIKCRYCNRKNDCVNESRPGVTSKVLLPHQALHYVGELLNYDDRIRVVGIAGPGDCFATPETSLETLRLIRAHYPSMLLCVATNGLAVLDYVDEVAMLDVSHVTITMNAVDPDIGEHIYSWARLDKQIFRGRAAAELLIERQKAAIQALSKAGVMVKINTVIIPGINDEHAQEVARTVASLGAQVQNCLPLYPSPDTEFANYEQPGTEIMGDVRRKSEIFIPQMRHCGRCRADAVGILGEEINDQILGLLEDASNLTPAPTADRPYVAVASHEGILVNQHLGEADQFWILGKKGTQIELVGTRPAPAKGTGNNRWELLADELKDCRMVLVSGAGPKPKSILKESGLHVEVTEGLIMDLTSQIFAGRKIKAVNRPHKCGATCSGDATGCG